MCSSDLAAAAAHPPWWRRALRHGFGTLPSDIGTELLIGLGIAGLIGALVPASYLADKLPAGLPGMLLMMAVGIPMYVCSTASVPIALGLMQAGVSPGAALVFLITGPATNAATLGALGRMLGSRAGAVYLVCLATSALLAGLATDLWVIPAFPAAAPSCHVEPVSWSGHMAAALLLAVLLGAKVRKRAPKAPPPASAQPDRPAARARRHGGGEGRLVDHGAGRVGEHHEIVERRALGAGHHDVEADVEVERLALELAETVDVLDAGGDLVPRRILGGHAVEPVDDRAVRADRGFLRLAGAARRQQHGKEESG